MKEPKESKAGKKPKTRPFTTNVPVRCTACQVETFIWKYSIKQHFLTVHGGLGVPSEMGSLDISE